MRTTNADQVVAIGLATSVAVQGMWLGFWAPGQVRLQWLLVAGLAALAIHQAWHARRRWFTHADMLMLMGGFGGLGMMIGSWIDLGLPMAGNAIEHHHHHAIGLVSWMTGVMLLFAVPPGVALSRCLAPVRRTPWVVVAVAIDVLGMLAGMFAAHTWWAMPLAHTLGSHFAGMHLAMLGGMLGGMIPAMLLRDWLFRFLESRRASRSYLSSS